MTVGVAGVMTWPTRGAVGAGGALRVRPAIAAVPVSMVTANAAASAKICRRLGVVCLLFPRTATATVVPFGRRSGSLVRITEHGAFCIGDGAHLRMRVPTRAMSARGTSNLCGFPGDDSAFPPEAF